MKIKVRVVIQDDSAEDDVPIAPTAPRPVEPRPPPAAAHMSQEGQRKALLLLKLPDVVQIAANMTTAISEADTHGMMDTFEEWDALLEEDFFGQPLGEAILELEGAQEVFDVIDQAREVLEIAHKCKRAIELAQELEVACKEGNIEEITRCVEEINELLPEEIRLAAEPFMGNLLAILEQAGDCREVWESLQGGGEMSESMGGAVEAGKQWFTFCAYCCGERTCTEETK